MVHIHELGFPEPIKILNLFPNFRPLDSGDNNIRNDDFSLPFNLWYILIIIGTCLVLLAVILGMAIHVVHLKRVSAIEWMADEFTSLNECCYSVHLYIHVILLNLNYFTEKIMS